MSIHRCAGRCGTPVRDADTWCFGCWADFANNRAESVPVQTEPVKDSNMLRFELLEAAEELALGPERVRAAALETISHLVTVLQHSQTNP